MQWYRAPNPEQMAWRSILPWRYHVDRHQCAVFQRFFIFILLPSQLNSKLGHPSLIFEEKNALSFQVPSLVLTQPPTHTNPFYAYRSLSLSPSLSCPSLPVYQSFSLSVRLFFQHCTRFLSTYWSEAIASSVQSRYWRHTHTHLL